MPIFKETDSPRVFYPETDYIVAKYFDLSKYISLLQRNSLFFCRLDELEDKFEGISPKLNFTKRVEWYKHRRDVVKDFDSAKTDEDIELQVKAESDYELSTRPNVCINCWNRYDVESAALWKIYTENGKGVMIKSTISKLHQALNSSSEALWISEIDYITRNEDLIPDYNAIFPVIHKSKAYQYETEVRLIYELLFNNKISLPHETFNWKAEEIEKGLFVPVDLDILIDEIVVSPFSPNLKSIIMNLTSKYGLSKNVINSELSPE